MKHILSKGEPAGSGSFHCPYQKREIDPKAFGEFVDWVGIDKNAEKIEMDWNKVADEGMILKQLFQTIFGKNKLLL